MLFQGSPFLIYHTLTEDRCEWRQWVDWISPLLPFLAWALLCSWIWQSSQIKSETSILVSCSTLFSSLLVFRHFYTNCHFSDSPMFSIPSQMTTDLTRAFYWFMWLYDFLKDKRIHFLWQVYFCIIQYRQLHTTGLVFWSAEPWMTQWVSIYGRFIKSIPRRSWNSHLVWEFLLWSLVMIFATENYLRTVQS